MSEVKQSPLVVRACQGKDPRYIYLAFHQCPPKYVATVDLIVKEYPHDTLGRF